MNNQMCLLPTERAERENEELAVPEVNLGIDSTAESTAAIIKQVKSWHDQHLAGVDNCLAVVDKGEVLVYLYCGGGVATTVNGDWATLTKKQQAILTEIENLCQSTPVAPINPPYLLNKINRDEYSEILDVLATLPPKAQQQLSALSNKYDLEEVFEYLDWEENCI